MPSPFIPATLTPRHPAALRRRAYRRGTQSSYRDSGSWLFFENENRVLIYLCDASDNRPKARQTLFSRWHRNMADMVNHTPVQIPIEDAVVYGGMLTRKDFPYSEIVQEHLVDQAGKLILEKFGR